MKIYRKRYIPNEIVDISKDEVILLTEDLLVTKWLPINPRGDIASGKSYTFLKKGWKISEFYNQNAELVCWYCDIIDCEIKDDVYTTIDLLVDIKVYPDGTYEVLDLDELDEALELGLISEEQKDEALTKLNGLLEIVKSRKFPPEECK